MAENIRLTLVKKITARILGGELKDPQMIYMAVDSINKISRLTDAWLIENETWIDALATSKEIPDIEPP